MKQEDIYYGQEHDERLDCDLEDALAKILDNACTNPGESFSETAKNVDWPIKILGFKRRKVNTTAKLLASDAIESVFEILDEEYGNPEEGTEPTEAVKEAAAAFAKAVLDDYVSWTCEPNGEVFKYTREQIEKEEAETAEMPKRYQPIS